MRSAIGPGLLSRQLDATAGVGAIVPAPSVATRSATGTSTATPCVVPLSRYIPHACVSELHPLRSDPLGHRAAVRPVLRAGAGVHAEGTDPPRRLRRHAEGDVEPLAVAGVRDDLRAD